MKFILEIPDEQFAELVEAVALRRGWTPTVIDRASGEATEVPNPKSKEDVLADTFIAFCENEVTAYRANSRPPVERAKIDAVKQ